MTRTTTSHHFCNSTDSCHLESSSTPSDTMEPRLRTLVTNRPLAPSTSRLPLTDMGRSMAPRKYAATPPYHRLRRLSRSHSAELRIPVRKGSPQFVTIETTSSIVAVQHAGYAGWSNMLAPSRSCQTVMRTWNSALAADQILMLDTQRSFIR